MFSQFKEIEVLSSSPLELVNIMYDGALESVGAARRHLAAGRIAERSRQITRAWEIIQQLKTSLNPSHSQELTRSLNELYSYIQTRLLDANAQQQDPPLAEAEALLSTLAEAWRSLDTPAMPVAESAYVPVSCRA